MPEVKIRKVCPDCGSADTQMMTLSFRDEEYIFCKKCKQLKINVVINPNAKN